MSDNGTTENEPTIVKHTHFKPSYAATIINYLFDASTAAGRRWGAPPADYGCIHCFFGLICGGSIL